MSTVSSTYMSLPVPVVGLEPGPTYATDMNNCMLIIDQHSHTSGSGVPITPDALNINASVAMNNNALVDIAALTLQPQSIVPADVSLYASGDDLYFVDGNGNNIRITQSGSVAGSAGTITGLPSGSASASFGAGTFVFQASTNTSAVIDGGSFILRNNSASSKGLTLAPPNAMGADYSITLPALPAQTNVMTLDASGNMGSQTYNQVYAARTMPVANPASLGGFAKSAPTDGIAFDSTPVQVVTVTITTSGRPVVVGLTSYDPGNSTATLEPGGGGGMKVFLVRTNDNVTFYNTRIGDIAYIAPSVVTGIDFPTAGTWTYAFYLNTLNGVVSACTHVTLYAYEL